MFACNCTHSCGVLARPSTCATHARAALSCGSGGSGAARLRLCQGVPLFYRCCSGGYIHPRFITALTLPPRPGNMLVCCDPWRQRRATTLHYMRVSNTQTCIVFCRSLSKITCGRTSGGDHSWILLDTFNRWLHFIFYIKSARFLLSSILSCCVVLCAP